MLEDAGSADEPSEDDDPDAAEERKGGYADRVAIILKSVIAAVNEFGAERL